MRNVSRFRPLRSPFCRCARASVERIMSLYTIETSGALHPGLDREWLLTNGLGGFASSTVVGCNTRRYHGLLCAANNPPVGRVVLLSRIGEIVKLDGNPELLELSVNCFRQS